jgi:succinate dehydrogenase / fumarate reductase cytochrome b subunit
MASDAAAGKPGAAPRARPVSPHLQIWRWTPTMAASITHRAAGAALYAGTIALALLVFSAAAAPGLYQFLAGVLGSPFGALILFGYAFALVFHMLNGLRHLYWDMGRGLDLKSAKMTAIFAFAAAFVAAVIITVAALSAKGA